MSPKEIYYKLKYLADGMPVAVLAYVYTDEDKVIQIGKNICISFRDDMLNNIMKIEMIEKEEGFMFWNISPEGEKFFTENWKVIGSAFAKIILNQK